MIRRNVASVRARLYGLGMVKFDPDGFAAMMARIEAEEREKERQQHTLRSPYEDQEPDYEYMPG
ncbi:hypothetical protein RM50_12325 [Pseudarthrobacter phenanthrenivorans]|uniref:Uncharacterized protein n=1 Tax=Pseudarthrobacter phenanthrenivorans TaxID=361575 RepID=A0A0B4EI60_PSEPS|nr:hypothetical protein RM50_12325 [Pseudarthrobacter phenanthrenivorans]